MSGSASKFFVSLTFDVEMCTNFPYWSSVWDHRKGAIDTDTKRYVVKLCDFAREARVKLQFFVLGANFADSDIEYLQRVAADGHAIGNHTFHHSFVKAKTFEQLQPVYRNNPLLVQQFSKGQHQPLEVIGEEMRQTSELVKQRLGVTVRGFRTPGGFANGLADAPAVQKLLKDDGYAYASAHYNFAGPRDPKPTLEAMRSVMRESLLSLQPYRYPNGLLEIPMMGISDVWAFRVLDLEREEWIRLVEHGVDVAAERRLIYSILMHPCVLSCRDPHAATVQRIIERVTKLGGEFVTNDEIAARQPVP